MSGVGLHIPVRLDQEYTLRMEEMLSNQGTILNRLETIMQELEALRAQVEATKGVHASAVALIQGMSAKLNELAQNATDIAALKAGVLEVANELNQSDDELANAITANTPGQPAEPTT